MYTLALNLGLPAPGHLNLGLPAHVANDGTLCALGRNAHIDSCGRDTAARRGDGRVHLLNRSPVLGLGLGVLALGLVLRACGGSLWHEDGYTRGRKICLVPMGTTNAFADGNVFLSLTNAPDKVRCVTICYDLNH